MNPDAVIDDTVIDQIWDQYDFDSSGDLDYDELSHFIDDALEKSSKDLSE